MARPHKRNYLFLASIASQNDANSFSYKVAFWREDTKVLVKQGGYDSWLPRLEVDGVINEEYLETNTGI